MRPIIVGYEATAQADDAVRLTRTMAGVLSAKPVVATVFPFPAHLFPSTELKRVAELDSPTLFARPRAILSDEALDTRVIVDPSPARALQGLAEREQAALIVVGSSRHGPIGRVLLGSVGASLLHGSPCAVAVAPTRLAAHHSIRRIGVGFDGSPEAFSALEAAISLARRLDDGASLDLFTAWEQPAYGIGTSSAILSASDWYGVERDEKQRILNLGLARVPADLTARGHLLSGNAGVGLTDAAGDADLMLVGSRGYGPLRRTLVGSTAEHLLHGASCPVLILPRGAGFDAFGLNHSSARVRRASGTTTLPGVETPS